MRKTERILEKMQKNIEDIDRKLGKLEECQGRGSSVDREKELDEKIREVEMKEKVLMQKIEFLERYKENVVKNSSRVQRECLWFFNESKFLFCREFVFEALFRVEKQILKRDEEVLKASKIVCVENFSKIEKTLLQFEQLKKGFEGEARSFYKGGIGKKEIDKNRSCSENLLISRNGSDTRRGFQRNGKVPGKSSVSPSALLNNVKSTNSLKTKIKLA
jgi:hypothetical protein